MTNCDYRVSGGAARIAGGHEGGGKTNGPHRKERQATNKTVEALVGVLWFDGEVYW
jgi:hypothetical protein